MKETKPEPQIPKKYLDMVGTKQRFNGYLFNNQESFESEEFDVISVRFSEAFVISLKSHTVSHAAIEFLLKNDNMKRAKWSRPFVCYEVMLI